jgi:hypothetical protein
MSRVGFEPTILVFEGAKTVHVFDGAATVIGEMRSLSMVKKKKIAKALYIFLQLRYHDEIDSCSVDYVSS